MFGPDGISFKPMSLCLGKDLAVIIRQCQCNFSVMNYRRGLESAEQIWYKHWEASKSPFMSQREIKGYHAHIYYDPASREAAARVRAGLANFNVQLGSWHDEPVGPHPQAMYQALFANDEFARVVPWLMVNRQGLTVLVHPSTGDSYGDHLERSLWLGEVLKLKEEVLRRG